MDSLPFRLNFSSVPDHASERYEVMVFNNFLYVCRNLLAPFPFILCENKTKISRKFGVFPMVPMACQCHPKFPHWLPLVTIVTIGTNGMTPMVCQCLSMATNGFYHWQQILMTTNENDEQIGTERKEMTSMFSVSRVQTPYLANF